MQLSNPLSRRLSQADAQTAVQTPAAQHAVKHHKPLLPLAARDVALFLCSFIILALAAGAGIGKRGVLVLPDSAAVNSSNIVRSIEKRAGAEAWVTGQSLTPLQ